MKRVTQTTPDRTTWATLAALAALAILFPAQALASSEAEEKKLVYEMNFQEEELDSVPADFLVLDGMFAVKEEDGNRFLELPGAPLDSFGSMFGPRAQKDMIVQARAYGTRRGRRYPMIGVGLNGVMGYKLKITPAKRKLELYRGDNLVTGMDYSWESGTWTVMKLRVEELENGDYKVQGKAWVEGTGEPDWQIETTDEEEPYPGQAAIWCSPFAGTPIRFDDLKVWSFSNSES